jgi:predicted aldo/keto reductase-like oxidoreductase
MMKKLGFGCMRLPTLGADDKVDIPQFSRMVDEFLAHGFTYFDTSYVYHGGKSEDALRQALVERHPRGSFTITTKLPVFLLKERADTRRFFAEQLARLGTDYVDYYWLHALNAASYENAVTFGCIRGSRAAQKRG